MFAGSKGSGSGDDPDAQPSSSAAEGRLPQSRAPAFLLVHGFGAFGEQWRGQIKALTAAGYQVHCLAWSPRLGQSGNALYNCSFFAIGAILTTVTRQNLDLPAVAVYMLMVLVTGYMHHVIVQMSGRALQSQQCCIAAMPGCPPENPMTLEHNCRCAM